MTILHIYVSMLRMRLGSNFSSYIYCLPQHRNHAKTIVYVKISWCLISEAFIFTNHESLTVPLAFELVYSLFKEQYPLENDDEGNQYLCLPGTGQRLSSKEVLGEIKRISEIYRNLVNKQEEIDFGPPVVRFAYIYKYVPVHIRMVQKVLEDWNRQGCELRTLMRYEKREEKKKC